MGISMRLGPIIDDHFARCKRTMDHAIVAMTGDDIVKWFAALAIRNTRPATTRLAKRK